MVSVVKYLYEFDMDLIPGYAKSITRNVTGAADTSTAPKPTILNRVNGNLINNRPPVPMKTLATIIGARG